MARYWRRNRKRQS